MLEIGSPEIELPVPVRCENCLSLGLYGDGVLLRRKVSRGRKVPVPSIAIHYCMNVAYTLNLSDSFGYFRRQGIRYFWVILH
jgi:hypothetical protein